MRYYIQMYLLRGLLVIYQTIRRWKIPGVNVDNKPHFIMKVGTDNALLSNKFVHILLIIFTNILYYKAYSSIIMITVNNRKCLISKRGNNIE